MKPSAEDALKRAQAEIEDLKRLVCGLYSTGQFLSKAAMPWIGPAADIWIRNEKLRPKRAAV